jgi:hypothetical protein
MRSRMAMLLALTALAATALAAPVMASASNWTKSGMEIKKELHWNQEGAVSFSGPMALSGGIGNFECNINAGVTLGAGATGQLNEFSSSSCNFGANPGTIGAICNEVVSVSAALPKTVTASEVSGKRVITFKEGQYTYKFAGNKEPKLALCPTELTFTGDVTATPNNAESISSVSLSGTVKYNSNLMGVSGTLSASPAGKFGITYNHLVTVAGSIGWSGAEGSTSCPFTGLVSLEPGSSGTLSSLSWDLSKCSVGGTIAAACGSKVSSVTTSSPWTLTDEGTSIKVSGVSITFTYLSCGRGGAGTLTATPDNTSAISSTTLTGTLAEGPVKRAWSGSMNWTPAGVYGL